jgi:hypothetical protein
MKSSTAIFESVFGIELGELQIPKWVKESLSRKIWREKKLVIVSAVCPDYERKDGRFTYRNMGSGLPFTASKHLGVIQSMSRMLNEHGVHLEYHVTLADTEFDLPLVMKHLASGDSELFLARCEESCRVIKDEARQLGIPIDVSARFTKTFPEWFDLYHEGFALSKREVEEDRSVRQDLHLLMEGRMPLYRAMAGWGPPDLNYCREMVLRQWAQYMAWGECASRVFGENVVMMNHSTPNLSRVNHPFFRKGRERIPIIQLPITTMP